MSHKSLYRKYRPQTFDTVVGQDHIVRTLQNAIDRNALSHAFLFTGPRGTGKTTTARLLAKALLCDKAPTSHPDGTCESCTSIAGGTHPDVYELDAASRTGVDNVREEIISRVGFASSLGKGKVYIIDEVHMLSTGAFNALLKTLEEPPSHVTFILCTTDPQKVPATITSRCQRFDFKSIDAAQMAARLKEICDNEGISYEDNAIDLIAISALGGMRDAISALEQVSVFGQGNITSDAARVVLGDVDSYGLSDIVDCIVRRDVAGAFRWVDGLAEGGLDAMVVAKGLASYLRDLFVIRVSDSPKGLTYIAPCDFEDAKTQAYEFESEQRIISLLEHAGDLMVELRRSTNQRLCLEIALTKMTDPALDMSVEALATRISALEAGAVINAGSASSEHMSSSSSSSLSSEIRLKEKVEAKSEPKPGVKQEQKSDTKPEPKPEVKSEDKPEPKPEVKSELQPEAKPEPKLEPQPEPKPEPKPEPRFETSSKTQTKSASKVEPDQVSASQEELQSQKKPQTISQEKETLGDTKPKRSVYEPEDADLASMLEQAFGEGFVIRNEKREEDQ